MAKNDLTQYALASYNAESLGANPHYYSSPAGIAWLLGCWLRKTGRSAPHNVKMSRGWHIRANEMLLRWHNEDQFERIN